MFLLLGGTVESRLLAEQLAQAGFAVCLSVYSEAGLKELPEHPPYQIRRGSLDLAGFGDLFKTMGIRGVVDAAHPFAKELHQTARQACQDRGIGYFRYARQAAVIPQGDFIHRAADYLEAAEMAFSFPGNVFLTIGSRNAGVFIRTGHAMGRRVIARILPEANSLGECLEAGLSSQDIIAIKGPFSYSLNKALFAEYQAGVVVSKEAGEGSGQTEKLAAAQDLGLPVVLISRPPEADDAATTFDELLEKLRAYLATVQGGSGLCG